MVVDVQKEDIKLIGHTVYNCNGNTAIICYTTYNHIEYILWQIARKSCPPLLLPLMSFSLKIPQR